ncbi:uncharacterized protein LOC125959146 [Anopheles darlingi]|uniref:uncharacterized protein LOC125959146 n=1 Tax=Anopheles darlingi TaxID=43151 RepID=UPI0021004693|nr:uncharacterized protein LOC125959146 [Anopheles darlingi]
MHRRTSGHVSVVYQSIALCCLVASGAWGTVQEGFANNVDTHTGGCGPNGTTLTTTTTTTSVATGHSDLPEPFHRGRDRRYVLNYPVNGGVAKVLFGFVAPVRFHHKLKRSINLGINLQANYRILPDIIFPHPESVWKNRYNDDAYIDTGRRQLYQLLEKLLAGTPGGNAGSNATARARNCLLRTICEIADTPLTHNGMVGELMDVVFTPGDTDELADEYKMARRYGANGVDCSRLYDACPWGHGILDTITALHW